MLRLLFIPVISLLSGCVVPFPGIEQWAFCGWTTYIEEDITNDTLCYEEREECEEVLISRLQYRYGNWKRFESGSNLLNYRAWFESYDETGEKVGHGYCGIKIVARERVATGSP